MWHTPAAATGFATLRVYIRPHFAKCSPVATLKLRLMSPTACAPSRVYKKGLMQSGLRWRRSHSRRRFPVAFAPYAPPSARPCGCRGTVALVSCVASIPASGLRPVITSKPPPTHRGLAAAQHWPPRAGCRPPPQGGSLNRAPLLLGFATSLVASNAQDTLAFWVGLLPPTRFKSSQGKPTLSHMPAVIRPFLPDAARHAVCH